MKEDKRLDDAFAASGLASQFKNAFKVGLDAYHNAASVMNKPLDEKALEAAVERFQAKYREFWNGSWPDKDTSRELLLAAFPALEAKQAGESEAVATVAQMGAHGEKWKVLHPLDALVDLPVGAKLYTAPPSLAAVQAENERLRSLVANMDLKLRSIRYHADNGHQNRPTHVRLRLISEEVNKGLELAALASWEKQE